jgi:DcaP outer membrane protein/Porin subfamily
MTRKRNIGRAAAVGGLTATIALLTGLPAASADELADLRANQELLQRRIDQLAQAAVPRGGGVPGAYGAEPIPGQPIIGGSFPRSFLIPGTDTSIRVGGFVDETLDYWISGGTSAVNGNQSTTVGVNGNLTTNALEQHLQIIPGLVPTVTALSPTAPLGSNAVLAVPGRPGFGALAANITHSRGNGIFSQSPRESRLNVETRTPTAWGESRTFIEFDMAGCNSFSCQTLLHVSDNLAFRFRYGYATLGGFLAGQANSNFSDPDANPEVLDFGGPVGQAGVVRIPQVRYTYAGPYGSAWSVSLETPDTDLITPVGLVEQDSNFSGAGTTTNPAAPTNAFAYFSNPYGIVAAGTPFGTNIARNGAPDVTFASYWSQPWGHVDFRLVGRELKVNDGRFIDKTFLGYGGGISGDVKPGWFDWNKDDFQWQFTAGNGIGRYLNDSTNGALATNFQSNLTTAAQAGNILVKPIPSFGLNVGYQHWWLPNLRSTISYGYAYYNVPSQLIGASQAVTQNQQLQTGHVNLIWSPVAFVDAGVEYMYGQRYTVAKLYGAENVVIGKFRVKF